MILYPVSLVFRALVALRRELYLSSFLPSHQLLLPVIVIGNISVGGTGKTPLTLALAQQLIERGWHPLIISRGYGRTVSSPQAASSTSSAAQVGDEPLLMARRDICPVWVRADRVATAHAALQACPQCDIVLCDDGLQHYRLQRDVEIAVIDGMRRFGNGYMLPAGPLREPVSRLQTVDAIVVNGGEAAANEYAMSLGGEIFYNLLDPLTDRHRCRLQTAQHPCRSRNRQSATLFPASGIAGHRVYSACLSRPSCLSCGRSVLRRMRCDTPDRKRCGKMRRIR